MQHSLYMCAPFVENAVKPLPQRTYIACIVDTLLRNIRILLAKRCWTQQELADELKVKRNTVSRWQLGKARPRPRYIKAMAALAKVDAAVFVGLQTQDEAAEKLDAAKDELLRLVSGLDIHAIRRLSLAAQREAKHRYAKTGS